MTTNLRRRIARIEAADAAAKPISHEIIPVKQLDPAERARLRAFLEQYVTDVEDLNQEQEDEGSAEESDDGE